MHPLSTRSALWWVLTFGATGKSEGFWWSTETHRSSVHEHCGAQDPLHNGIYCTVLFWLSPLSWSMIDSNIEDRCGAKDICPWGQSMVLLASIDSICSMEFPRLWLLLCCTDFLGLSQVQSPSNNTTGFRSDYLINRDAASLPALNMCWENKEV